jgi:alpha amylase-like protein
MRHPTLFQINTRIAIEERGRALGRRATLDDLPDRALDAVAAANVEWVYLLGVWRTGPASRQVSRDSRAIRAELERELPDLRTEDITGSPFAVRGYRVREEWGGDEAMIRLRRRLADRGMRLVLDYVVNHVALDHPWLDEHPEYFIHGTRESLDREPKNWTELRAGGKPAVLAYGRDPYFPGWSDTLQLDYRHAGLREAMTRELTRVAGLCDGVRCDMAMLVEPDVFARTWQAARPPVDGSKAVTGPFWPGAIARVRQAHPNFLFMAEVYWDREWDLQQEGFDFTYDKRLYDRLRIGSGHAVREHLLAEPGYQARSTRFLENHDEPRAAEVFPLEVHCAAAVIAFLVPGMRFLHEGQVDGRRVHTSMHLGRRPDERPDPAVVAFYERLLPCIGRPEVHDGEWNLWTCRPAWEGNNTCDDMIVFTWTKGERRLLVAVNYAPHRGQCYVTLELPELGGRTFTLVDLISGARYERSGDGLSTNGLYLDMPPWGHQVFEMRG